MQWKQSSKNWSMNFFYKSASWWVRLCRLAMFFIYKNSKHTVEWWNYISKSELGVIALQLEHLLSNMIMFWWPQVQTPIKSLSLFFTCTQKKLANNESSTQFLIRSLEENVVPQTFNIGKNLKKAKAHTLRHYKLIIWNVSW